MLIDTNTQLGVWPFTFTPDRTAAELLKHLRASGISRALVSHLGAVFQPDPMPSNRTLFAAVKRTPALVPVPVVLPLTSLVLPVLLPLTSPVLLLPPTLSPLTPVVTPLLPAPVVGTV